MIEVKALSKSFGGERAVDDVTFSIEKGEVVGFLGPNGAGKSTTMKMLTCYLEPSEGDALIDGESIKGDTIGIRNKIGYLPENTPLYSEMFVHEYLEFVAQVRQIPNQKIKKRLGYVVAVCSLETVLKKRIETLSKGFKQRVGLAQAMIHDPEILILDEPTSGLDPNQRVEIRELIRDLGNEKTVILSTHILPEVQLACNRMMILHQGKLVADGSSVDLESSLKGEHSFVVSFQKTSTNIDEALHSLGLFSTIQKINREADEYSFRLKSDASRDIRPDIFHFAVEQNLVLTELLKEQTTLEDLFRQFTLTEGETT